jgi:hypothetical protein
MADEATERITILLQARDAEFQRAMDRNNKVIARFEKNATKNVDGATKRIDANLKTMAGSFGSFAKGFAGGLIGAGIGLAINATLGQVQSLIDGIGELQDQADVLDMDVEELQGLRYGFQLAGVDADKLNAALQRFTSMVGDAAKGEGALAKVFSDAGVPLTDMNGELRSSSDLLREFADIVAATPAGAERLALASEVFGKAGRNLVLGLEGGRSGLDAMVEQARTAGAVLDEELVRRAEEIGDKWDALKMRINVALQEIAVGIADTGDKLASAISDNLSEYDVRPMTEAELELLDVTRQLADEVRLAGAYLATLGRDADAANMQDLAASVDILATKFEEGSISGEALTASLTKVAPAAQEALGWLDAIDGVDLSNAAARIGDLVAWLGDLRSAALLAANAVAAAVLSPTPSATGVTGPAGGPALPASELAPTAAPRPPRAPALLGEPDLSTRGGGGASSSGGGGQNDQLREAERLYEATRTEAEKYAAELADIDALLADGYISAETHARGLDMIAEKYGDASDAAQELEGIARETFVSLVRDAGNAEDALGNLLDKLADLAANAAWDALTSGDLFKGGIGAAIGSIFGGARASGGSVERGRAYLVNEDTPNSEIFVPSQNGGILNVPQAQAALRGSGGSTDRALAVSIGFDDSTGSLTAMVRNEAGRVVAASRASLVQDSMAAVQRAHQSTKAYLR